MWTTVTQRLEQLFIRSKDHKSSLLATQLRRPNSREQSSRNNILRSRLMLWYKYSAQFSHSKAILTKSNLLIQSLSFWLIWFRFSILVYHSKSYLIRCIPNTPLNKFYFKLVQSPFQVLFQIGSVSFLNFISNRFSFLFKFHFKLVQFPKKRRLSSEQMFHKECTSKLLSRKSIPEKQSSLASI